MSGIAEKVVTTVAMSSGWNWTATGAWAAFISLIAVIIRQVGPWREITISGQAKFQADLLRRLDDVEEELGKERHARELERRQHEAERALDRHRINNVTQCLDAMLLMLKRAPDQATAIIKDIEEMRSRQLQSEALEKAAIHAISIQIADEKAST